MLLFYSNPQLLIISLISIVDAYDAMTNDRPYRKAFAKEQAIAEIRRCSGTKYDPKLVEVFIKIMDLNYEYRKQEIKKNEVP